MKNLIKNRKVLETSIAILFILIGVSLRLLSHPPNFAPVAAIALFGGVYLSRKIALWLPLAIMVASDIVIGYYESSLMVFVYGSFLVCVVLGFWLKRHKKWYTILGSSLVASLVFFFLTNFAVWAFTFWYPKTIAGLFECYLMALPFFRNTLLGNLFYVTIFFGAYQIIEIWVKNRFRIAERAYRTILK